MKLTESKIRQIIREEILSESIYLELPTGDGQCPECEEQDIIPRGDYNLCPKCNTEWVDLDDYMSWLYDEERE